MTLLQALSLKEEEANKKSKVKMARADRYSNKFLPKKIDKSAN